MTIRNLDRLLAPRSVVLIGASDHSGTVGGTMVRNMLSGSYRGRVMLVNPRHASIDGMACYPDVAALPEVPDLAVIATPAPSVPAIVAALGERGCKAAVVISAGFGGSEGARLKQAMLDAARPHLMRLLGPNCVGLLVPGIGLNAGFAHLTPPKGRIAFLAQSGAIVTTVIDWAAARGIGFSYLLSMGEMADVDFADMLDYLAGDVETTRRPALCRDCRQCPQVYVGGAPRGSRKAGHRDQGGTPCRGRQGRPLPHRGARRRRCSL